MGEKFKEDDFWDLSKYSKPTTSSRISHEQYSKSRTSAVEISDTHNYRTSPSDIDVSDTVITRFIPPHSDSNFVKKNIILEYEPQNPLIKKVTLYSDKACNELFVADNLFIRERRALLDRTTTFKEHVPFYSYAPRYSQLNKAQLNWYIWWRQNARNQKFIKTDESYVMLYAYELAATTADEDKYASLDMLCSLITEIPTSDLGIVYKIIIRDIICDFCLIHNLPSPVHRLSRIERQVLFGSFLPEFFIDFSQTREYCAPILASTSLYDYRRSKCYNESNADIFKNAITGAINSAIINEDAFTSITSFTKGIYNGVTVDRHPFPRMVNIVNKDVKIEVIYYELSNIKSEITDLVRYSENKVREHLGIKNKIHVLAVNPAARAAIDDFFEINFPAQQFIDRRRKEARLPTDEHNDYDKLYDVPKVEISPERALEIDRESWDTTRKLTEAFEDTSNTSKIASDQPIALEIETVSDTPALVEEHVTSINEAPSDEQGVYAQLYQQLGAIASFINLCRGSSGAEQKKFALSHGMSRDGIADKINEAAVEIFGDIILEENDDRYLIIEDYLFLFN